MKILFIASTLMLFTLAACSGNQAKKNQKSDTLSLPQVKAAPVKLNTDTLQFIHFDGNFDYWYAFFLNSKKDTVRLVVDDNLDNKLQGRLLRVTWRPDTLTEAGDNDRKYSDKRMVSFKQIPGAPFVKPVTEEMAVQAVKDLEEFKANADRAGVSEKPTADKSYYQVETSTEADGNLSRFETFRVYVYPKYEIRIYKPGEDKELSLDEWRKAITK